MATNQESRRETLEDDISVHIFTASAALVGVCLMAVVCALIAYELV